MSKATIFVVSYSIIILVLFGVFCFLMSTVNPPQMKVEERYDTATETNLASFYLRNMEPSEIVEYGLEKSYDSPSLRASAAPSRKVINMTNLLPTVRRRNPHIVKVYPPIWPPKTRTTMLTTKQERNIHQLLTATPKTTNTTTATKSIIKNLNSTTAVEIITKLPESQIHRRSINAIEKKIDLESGSVVLKILDDDGQSRIEIKLNPNEILDSKIPGMYRSSLKTESKSSIVIEAANKDVEYVDINKLPDNTEIRILPNDTVVIVNEVHELGISTVDFINKTDTTRHKESMLTTQDTDRNVTGKLTRLFTVKNKTVATTSKYIVKKTDALRSTTKILNHKYKTYVFNTEPFNVTFTKLFGLKVMFDNMTRSFTKPYKVYDSENRTH